MNADDFDEYHTEVLGANRFKTPVQKCGCRPIDWCSKSPTKKQRSEWRSANKKSK